MNPHSNRRSAPPCKSAREQSSARYSARCRPDNLLPRLHVGGTGRACVHYQRCVTIINIGNDALYRAHRASHPTDAVVHSNTVAAPRRVWTRAFAYVCIALDLINASYPRLRTQLVYHAGCAYDPDHNLINENTRITDLAACVADLHNRMKRLKSALELG